jgi:site-specific DNA-adenine methylase
MRILLINKYHYMKGGTEKAYLDMSNILTEAGHEVAYFAMESDSNKETSWSRYFVSEVDYHNEKQSIGQKVSLENTLE